MRAPSSSSPVDGREDGAGRAAGAGGAVREAAALPLDGAALRGLMVATLARGAAVRFTARGWSMDPFIKDGDVVTVLPGAGRPRLGEVIAFSPPGGHVVVHRVVGCTPGGVLTRGDGAARDDGLVTPAELLGVTRRVERRGRPLGLGLGPERVLVAVLSRLGVLRPAVMAARRVRRGLARGV